MAESYDVIIVGAGPAGWSAATFLARAQVKTLVIGDMAQSGLADASEVLNYVGFPKGISGRELLLRMQEQAVGQGATFVSGEVVHIEPRFTVKTADAQELSAQNILLAHGANYIKINLPGEAELAGTGVHYCALCDGPLYKGKEVLVLGNGNYAAEEAIQLAQLGVKVRMLTHAPVANFSVAYQDLLQKHNIAITIGRADKVEAGTFIALGVASSHAFAQKLGLEMNGNFLKADENGRTNVPGVWCAGLARGGVNQVAKSVGEGASAAVNIIKTMKGLPQYLDHT